MISTSRGTIGVRYMPDGLDSGRCHLLCGSPAVVRVNIDGIYTSLCPAHLDELMAALAEPEPAPERR